MLRTFYEGEIVRRKNIWDIDIILDQQINITLFFFSDYRSMYNRENNDDNTVVCNCSIPAKQ